MIAQTAGAALAPLSGEQRQKLAGLAALAYDIADSHVAFDDWRHSEVRRVVHRAGLRDCLNMHYLPLFAHFHELLGNSGRATKALVKAETEPRTWALHALQKEAVKAKDVMPEAMKYARGFLRNKRGVSLDEASDRDIWHAVFTVRRKAQALRKLKRGGETVADVLARILPSHRTSRRADPDNEPF
jgi:hypothetical protein